MTIVALNAVEMFRELIRQGFVTPASDFPDLTLPTTYRTVSTMTAAGTGQAGADQGSPHAQLDSAPKGNSADAGPG
jgi:hypothetical protein